MKVVLKVLKLADYSVDQLENLLVDMMVVMKVGYLEDYLVVMMVE